MSRELVFVAGLVGLTVLLLLGFDAAGGGYQVYVPTGYIQEVQRLATENKLVYDCASERVEPQNLTAGERFFFANSYLRRDLAAWNDDGDRRPFLVEREEKPGGGCDGRFLGPNPSHHKQRLPTYEASRWRGSLYLKPGRAATVLTSPSRSLEVVGAPPSLLPLPAKAFEDVLFRPGAEGLRSQKLALKVNPWDLTFAELKNIGECAALEVKTSSPSLALNGCSLPQGWRVRLDGGDRLRVYGDGPLDDHYLVETGKRAGLVSFVSRVNGELRRRTFTDRLPMAKDIAYAVDAAVIAVKGPEGEAPASKSSAATAEKAREALDDFDVHLTLDPFLDQRLQRELGSFARKRYGDRPLRASLTVLDAVDGRVLALASYPSPADLDDLRLKSDGHRALLAQNHNFAAHPVGSATKPFLAAAAAALRPELSSLEVPCFPEGGEVPEALLGYPLGSFNLPADCQGAKDDRGRIDLPSFLEVSSNRYMLYMGLLALAEWQGGTPIADPGVDALAASEGYFLDGRRITRRPRLSVFRDVVGDDTRLTEVSEEPFMQRFRDLFGQRTHFRRSTLAAAMDLDPWGPVLDVAGLDRSDRAVVAFSPVSPAHVNLGANLIQSLRRDLYTVLLGNGNNRWSNVQLAEATARLVRGEPVVARLVDKVTVDVPDEAGEPVEKILWPAEAAADRRQDGDWDPWKKLDRGPILEGMRRVVESRRGTAHDLKKILVRINERVPDGVEYRALGKTGTPTLTPGAVKRSPTRPGPGAVKRFGKNEQVQSAALVLAVERYKTGEDPQVLALAIHVDSQGGSGEAVAVAESLLEPLVETYWPEDWLLGGVR